MSLAMLVFLSQYPENQVGDRCISKIEFEKRPRTP
jgi:hypothetical protein